MTKYLQNIYKIFTNIANEKNIGIITHLDTTSEIKLNIKEINKSIGL